MDPAGGFEALHRRQLAAVGLVILYHQRHAAVAEDIAQLIQLLIVEEMAKGELQPQSVQGLRFREQRREIRVKLAVVGEQRLRRRWQASRPWRSIVAASEGRALSSSALHSSRRISTPSAPALAITAGRRPARLRI